MLNQIAHFISSNNNAIIQNIVEIVASDLNFILEIKELLFLLPICLLLQMFQ